MNIETVNELIASLESAGELSIREQKFLKLAKAFKQLAAENVGLNSFIVDACWIVDDGQYCDATDFMPETPATDRIVAEAEARGVEKFIASLPSYADTEVNTYDDGVKAAIETTQTVYGPVFIKQLREVAK
ncbi:TPA: hypothetical protein ACHB00_005247 [Klebsiella pneumoniae]